MYHTFTADLESAIREEFHIPSAEECRVWHRYMTNTYELLSEADHSLQDAGLYNGQVSSHDNYVYMYMQFPCL